MSDRGNLIASIITGGFGATLGTIVTSIIQVISKRGESLASAADVITGAAEKTVSRLQRENEEMRKALVYLTEIDDEIILALNELHAPQTTIRKLKERNRAAKLALGAGIK